MHSSGAMHGSGVMQGISAMHSSSMMRGYNAMQCRTALANSSFSDHMKLIGFRQGTPTCPKLANKKVRMVEKDEIRSREIDWN